MLDLIDLSEWKTKNQIIKELHDQDIKTDERTLRAMIEKHNIRYFNHLEKEYIAHSPKGYIKTSDYSIIKKSIDDGKKRALNLLWKYSKTTKALGENNNLKLELEDMGIIDG